MSFSFWEPLLTTCSDANIEMLSDMTVVLKQEQKPINNVEDYHYYQNYCDNFDKVLKIVTNGLSVKFYENVNNFQSEFQEYVILLKSDPASSIENLNKFKLLMQTFFSKISIDDKIYKKAISHTIYLIKKLQQHIRAASLKNSIEVAFKFRLSTQDSKVCMDWVNLNLMQKCSLSIYRNNTCYYSFNIFMLDQNNKFLQTYSKKLHLGSSTFMEFKKSFIDFNNQFYLLQCP